MAGSSDKPIPVPSPTGMWQDAHRQIPAVKDGDPVGYVAAMTPLERALDALEKALPDPTDVAQGGFYPEDLRAMARAVLTAIREPSEGMVEAGLRRENYVRGCAAMFAGMIDAALAEGE